MIYIRDDIPSKLLLKHVFPDDIEGSFVELNFRKSKWLLMRAYHPPSQINSDWNNVWNALYKLVAKDFVFL